MTKSIEERVAARIAEVARVSDLIPGVIIIHDLPEFKVKFMSERGLRSIGATLEEVAALSNEEYHRRYFNPEDAVEYVPKIRAMLEAITDETVSYFQQVRTSPTAEWDWYQTASRILMRDDQGNPVLTISLAMKIDPEHHITNKISRLLEENNFLKKNYHQFSTLTKREIEMLKMIALGKSTQEISDQLFISTRTVETHRKNLRRKLNINSTYETSLYARAFDLI